MFSYFCTTPHKANIAVPEMQPPKDWQCTPLRVDQIQNIVPKCCAEYRAISVLTQVLAPILLHSILRPCAVLLEAAPQNMKALRAIHCCLQIKCRHATHGLRRQIHQLFLGSLPEMKRQKTMQMLKQKQCRCRATYRRYMSRGIKRCSSASLIQKFEGQELAAPFPPKIRRVSLNKATNVTAACGTTMMRILCVPQTSQCAQQT